MEWYLYPLVILAGIVAGVINTLAGSGSLVTLPMLVFLGLPSNVANATNRVGVVLQNIVGITTFQRSGKLNLSNSLWLVLASVPGAERTCAGFNWSTPGPGRCGWWSRGGRWRWCWTRACCASRGCGARRRP